MSLWVFGKTPNIKDSYTIGAQLGSPGQFGVAFRGRNKHTNQDVAIKQINKGRFIRYSLEVRQAYIEDLRSEINVMKKIDHPSCIKLYEVFEDKTHLFLVMELCTGGELFDRISTRARYSEKDAVSVLRQMLQAMLFLHQQGIAHCDIKPDNFLFSDSKEDATLKLIDFGMSKVLYRREYIKTRAGTPYYMAPEVIRRKFNHESDIWSCGVVMYVMLYGFPPFYLDQNTPDHDRKIMQLILRGFTPETKSGYGPWFPDSIEVSDSAKDLISKLIMSDIAERYNAEEALSHPWMKGETASESPINAQVLTSLRSFNKNAQFRNSLLTIFTNTLSQQQISELETCFKAMDKDKDGSISLQELEDSLKGGSTFCVPVGLETEIKTMFDNADIDGNGKISYDEILMVAVHRRLIAKEERLFETFRQLDTDGNGKISLPELRNALSSSKISVEEVDNLLKIADADGDGNIDYEEFLRMWYDKHETKDEKKQ